MIILDGKTLSHHLIESYKTDIDVLKEKKVIPCLCVILIGDNPESTLYVKMKKKECEKIGIKFKLIQYDNKLSQESLIYNLNLFNNDPSIHGILIQLPLPNHISNGVLNFIDPYKDVDGLTMYSSGALIHNVKTFMPCTPQGCIDLLKAYDINVKGLNITIIGTSNLVGLPLSHLLLQLGGTITLCNINTKDVKSHTINADMVISCCGVSNMVKGDWIKEGCIIIDIGINKIEGSNKITGDVEFESVKDKVSYITPVPGGVGPMTIAMLIKQTIQSAEYSTNHKY